jgi:death-on-curing protein
MPRATLFGEELHPTLFDKAAAYLFHIVCNYPFLDGNKRTAAIAALVFLRQNHIRIKFTKKQSLALEELVVNTAKGKTTKGEIAEFFRRSYKGNPSLKNKSRKILRKKRSYDAKKKPHPSVSR